MADERLTPGSRFEPADIEKLKPQEDRYEIADPRTPGLRLRVLPSGTKVFVWRVNAIKRVISIGEWTKAPAAGKVTLSQARRHFDDLRLAYKENRLDAALEELRAATAPPPPAKAPLPEGTVTVKMVADDFLAYLDTERRRPEQARRTFEVEVIPVLGEKAFNDVTKEDITALVKAIAGRGSKVMAHHTLALVKQFFTWAADTKDGLRSPGFPKPKNVGAKKAEQRDMEFTPDELAAFWRAVDTFKGFTPTVRSAIHLLVLLGCRSGELRQATWGEFDLDAGLWVIPPEHQKEPVGPWKVPLPPKAVAILRELEALAKSFKSKHVLASPHAVGEGDRPLSEKAINHAMRRLFTGAKPVLVFPARRRPTPHDLRRVLRTYARRDLGVPHDVAEKLLAHSLGTVAETYGRRADLFEERKAALEKWALYIESLVAPGETKVAFMRAKKAR